MVRLISSKATSKLPMVMTVGRDRRARRGSALLIVLGMLSFMVISAVAFSAYMRFARLPSSFLRRSVSSSMLVKAALARAIDELDASIGNNPHPGIGEEKTYFPRTSGSTRGNSYLWNRNHFKHRVFMGGTNDYTRVPMVSQMSTVSPLCLEALAYLPPAIVNEVRYYSRHTQTAEWHEMDYDAGRYAYCAVDVSDMFDVNALHADTPRLSSSGSRISLAYLFENFNHDQCSPLSGMTTAAQWDTALEDFRSDNSASGKGANDSGSDLPLISLADYNLALFDKGLTWATPFTDYVRNNLKKFYGNISETAGDNDENREIMRRLTFVTDSYCSPTNTTDVYDLSTDEGQPIDITYLTQDRHTSSFYTLMNKFKDGAKGTEMKSFLCNLSFCELYDYLDKDDNPLSLAIPTHERTPMICGINVGDRTGTLEIKGSETANAVGSWEDKSPVYHGDCYGKSRKVKYTMKGIPNASTVKALLVFPYRNSIDDEDTYEIGGRLCYYLTAADNEHQLLMRTGNNSDSDLIHLGNMGSGALKNGSYEIINECLISVPLEPKSITPKSIFKISNGDKGQGMVTQVNLQPGMIPTTIELCEIEQKFPTKDQTPLPEGVSEGDPMPGNQSPTIQQGAKPDPQNGNTTIDSITVKLRPTRKAV